MKKSEIMHLCGGGGASLNGNSEESQVISRKYIMINKVRSTHKELTSTYSRLTTKALGFTMAEILLSLTIIGVVAAITLPSLTGNINERTWNTQRKAFYARMSQAMALMPALNGYGTTEENAAETFITNGLAKVLKINNICATDSLSDCGLVSLITNGKASKITIPTDTQSLNGNNVNVSGMVYPAYIAAAFETANGEAVLTFYNRNCKPFDVIDGNQDGNRFRQVPAKMCANFIYDLNGKKGPNTFGKDIGVMTVFYPSDPVVVAPYTHPHGGELTINWGDGAAACRDFDEDYRMPNLEETMSMILNSNLVGLESLDRYWSSKRFDAIRAWFVSYTGNISYTNAGHASDSVGISFSMKCVKR